MVRMILGASGTGKSAVLSEQIKQTVKQDKTVYLFVPEQFTFETERKYFHLLAPRYFRNLRVLSFSRLAHHIFKEFGGVAGDYADDSIKLILMDLALHQVEDGLQVYSRAVKNTGFCQEMLKLVEELKNASLSALDFERKVAGLEQGSLREKSRDISLIYSGYTALLSANYKDSLDDISRACEKIKKHRYFAGTVVFIDEFKGFTAKELELIRLLIRQAEQVTVTLAAEAEAFDQENSLFYSVNQTYQKLKRMTHEENQKLMVPIVLREYHRFQNPELVHLADFVFRSRIKRYQGENRAIRAVLAANEYEEVNYLLATIRQLVESGEYHYRDIVVISRDLEIYRSTLETAFEKYHVPCYLDTLKSISSTPLVRFTELAFQCVSGSFSTENILSMLKCGLTPFTYTEIARFENYCYLWNLKKQGLMEPFTLSIYGTNPPKNEQQQQEEVEILETLNRIRERVMNAVTSFQRRISNASAGQISQAYFDFLEEMGVREQTDQLIEQLQLDDLSKEMAIADEYRRVWEIVGQILDIMAATLAEQKITPKRFGQLFGLLAANFDMGTIPQMLDSVTIGSAERIRTDCPKVVFVLGVNDGIFPYIPENFGIYTDSERGKLIELGMELAKPVKERIKEERFIAYKTLTTPSQRLYLTARKADIKGSVFAPSHLFSQLKKMFGSGVITDADDLDRLYFCRTRQTAFSELAYQFRQDTPLSASLKAYFSKQPDYVERVAYIEQNLVKGHLKITNLDLAKELFGSRVVMSPSRIEQYHKCKFRYFCEYGMELKKRERIQLNQVSRGTMIHEVLYRVCSKIQDFSEFDRELIRRLIREAVDEYVLQFGGYERQTERFRYLYRRIERGVLTLLQRMFEELSQSQFHPSCFEYAIGQPGNTPPFIFRSEDGITIRIQGTIDRVDEYLSPEGKRYLRIIDYKTGIKEFRLSDLINGVNLQMFLYLLCLQRGKTGPYAGAEGAGVLYMPAGEPNGQLLRNDGEQERENAKNKYYQMKGVLLDYDEVMVAMEPDLKGRFIPVSVKASVRKGKTLPDDLFVEHQANEAHFYAAGMESLLTDCQIQQLFDVIEESVGKMVGELYHGNIEAKPLVGKSYHGCDYCSFGAVCGFEATEAKDKINEYQEFQKKELFEYLQKKESEKGDC